MEYPTPNSISKGVDAQSYSSNLAYPADTTPILVGLEKQYMEGDGSSIPVSFRDLVPWLRMGERATHYLHSYPAKLLPQIAHFFLAADGWSDRSEIVLDPFSGTGTVALEAHLSGRTAYYADVNPLARLITSAKTTRIDATAALELLSAAREIYGSDSLTLLEMPWVVNINYWFSQDIILQLRRLRSALEVINLGQLSSFVWATFSAVVRKCSFANPRFSVPVRSKDFEKNKNLSRPVIDVFAEQFTANVLRHKNLAILTTSTSDVVCIGTDARNLNSPFIHGGRVHRVDDESVGLIITSPPYAGAQKYIRASSLNLGWLGLTGPDTLRALDQASIGREHFKKGQLDGIPDVDIPDAQALIERIGERNATRAAISANYLVEMKQSILEMARVLKPRGKIVLVIGDNSVCDELFPSSKYLAGYLELAGLRKRIVLVDKIKSRGLITKRSGGVTEIKSETILVYEKP